MEQKRKLAKMPAQFTKPLVNSLSTVCWMKSTGFRHCIYLIRSFCLWSVNPNAFISNNLSFLKIKSTKGLFHITLYHVQHASRIFGSLILFCICSIEEKMKKENMKQHSPSGDTLSVSFSVGFVRFTHVHCSHSIQEKHHQPAAASSASLGSYNRISHWHPCQLL